jgi:hypothetical protein
MTDENLESALPAEELAKPAGPRFRPFRAMRLFLTRILLFYWVCFTFPFPLDLIGLPLNILDPDNQPDWFQPVNSTYSDIFFWVQPANQYYGEAFTWLYTTKDAACQWVGEHVLGVEVTLQATGSGDTMRAYVGCFCAGVIAVGLAVLWSILARLIRWRKPAWCPDAVLSRIVTVVVRFFLCQMLFSYGFAKLFPLQFAPPSSFRLNQQLGDMSPMGLLWTFMGFSPPYEMFTGAVEVLAGLLLVTRRTTLLGAMLATMAMVQVFVLNMCFDVPVKLYSIHYLVMSFFLLLPELPRLINVLLLGRAVPAKLFPPLLGSARLNRTALVLRTLLVVAMIYSQFATSYQGWMRMYGGPPGPVAGRWDVESMVIDKKDLAKDDPELWSWIDFSAKSLMRVSIPRANPKMVSYRVNWIGMVNKVTLTRFIPPRPQAVFDFELKGPDKLILQGKLEGKAIAVRLKPAVERQYELMNRGFHWIQELPYNR